MVEGERFHKLENINEQLNLTHYWILLLKYKRIFILAPALFALLGYFVALNINPIFQSQATLVIEESSKNIVQIEEVYAGNQGRGFGSNINYINNQIQIIESDEVLGNIFLDEKMQVKAEALYKKIPRNFILSEKFTFFNFLSEDKLVKKPKININTLGIGLDMFIGRNSDVVNITIKSGNAELAKFLLEQVIESYLKYDVDTKVKVTNYANAQINGRLTKLLEQMEIAEQKLWVRSK